MHLRRHAYTGLLPKVLEKEMTRHFDGSPYTSSPVKMRSSRALGVWRQFKIRIMRVYNENILCPRCKQRLEESS
jgi:hypothetical protein